VGKIIEQIQFWKQIQLTQYIYFNYFCKQVKREGTGKIVPYKNAIIDLEPDSKIVLGDNNIEIGLNKLKNSRTETYVRLREGAIWKVLQGCGISYGCTIEVLKNANLKTGYFTMNSFSVLIAEQDIEMGEDVMIGRNTVIYDSDFHTLVTDNVASIEKTVPVKIGNHVWLTSNVLVLKGTSIRDNSVIAAGSLLKHDVESDLLVGNDYHTKILKKNIKWER